MVFPSLIAGGVGPAFASGWRKRARKSNAYSAALAGRQSPMVDFAKPK
jgi:hypothetical protein